MTPIGLHRVEPGETKSTRNAQVAVRQADVNGGRYRIRTYDFHRVKVALYR
jgi:hypothetical protein